MKPFKKWRGRLPTSNSSSSEDEEEAVVGSVKKLAVLMTRRTSTSIRIHFLLALYSQVCDGERARDLLQALVFDSYAKSFDSHLIGTSHSETLLTSDPNPKLFKR